MNRLSIADRAKILGMLVEGSSLRSCARMADHYAPKPAPRGPYKKKPVV